MAGLIGSQTPRFRLVPESEFSFGDEAIELAHRAGLDLDEWQQNVLRDSLRVGPDGKWAATSVGLVVPRQQGKSVILDARQLAGLFLLGEELQISSAHEFKTCAESFRRVMRLIEGTPDLDARVSKVFTSHGQEGIELKDGSRLRFVARSGGSGRGFAADAIYLDEAYALQKKELAAMVPTMAARSLAGTTQLWYASSAGLPNSEVLADIRERGRDPKTPRMVYEEWSAPDDMDTADPAALVMANPGLNIRMSEAHAEEERASLGDEEYRRERLGIWAKLGGDSVISRKLWAACLDEDSEPGKTVALGVDVPPGRDSAVIAAASFREDGKIHVEIVDQREGTSWVSTRLAELRRHRPAAIVVDPGSAAGALEPDLKRDRVRYQGLSVRQYGQACGKLFDLIGVAQLAHIGQEPLDDAVDAARQRPLGETAWAWSRKNAVADISPLVAVTMALHGLLLRQRRTEARADGRSQERSILVLRRF